MSTTGTHVRNRHENEQGMAIKRETHGNAGIDPSVEGVSWNDARDGEQSQTADYGPGSVDGGIIAPGAITGAVHIVPETLTLDLFAENIRAPTIVDVLPPLPDPIYPQGALVFLTTDEKLYRSLGGTSWTVAVDGADIAANSITAGQIAAGAIGATEIAAGSITTEKFHVGAKAPGVENSTAEVLIDSDGLTILNGKLSLLDAAGTSVLTAAGFQGSWLTFVRTGMYNAQFGAGTLGPLVYTTGIENVKAGSTELPYWTYNLRSDPAMTAELKASSLAPSGRYVEFTAGLLSGTAKSQFLRSVAVPVSALQSYSVRAQYAPVNGDISKPVQIKFTMFFYDVDWNLLDQASYYGPTLGSSALGTWSWAQGSTMVAPDYSAWAIVSVGAEYPSGTTATHGMRLAEVGIFESALKARTVELEGVFMQRIGDGLISISDPGELYDYTGITIRPRVGGAGQVAVHGSSNTWSSVQMLADASGTGWLKFGSGGAAWDVELFRGAENRLDLYSGDSFRIVGGQLQFGASQYIDVSGGYLRLAGAPVRTLMQGTTGGGVANLGSSALEIYQAAGAADSYMTFHHNGVYARHFGMDAVTNDLFTGGWSAGATKQRIFHGGNYNQIPARGGQVRKTSSQAVTTQTSGAPQKITGYDVTDRTFVGCSWNPYGGSEIRVDEAGWYLITATASFQANASGHRILAIFVGSGATPTSQPGGHTSQAISASPQGDSNLTIAIMYNAGVNQTFAAAVRQGSGSTLNVYNVVLGVTRIGL